MSTAIRDQLRQALIEDVAPSFRTGVPLEQQRQVLDAMGAQGELPEGTQVDKGELAGIPTEWIGGPEVSRDHALLHLHGGGYVMGSCDSHRGLAAWLAASAGIRVALPEYRLAPEHPYPAALDDAVAAYRGLLDRGFEAGKIGVTGDSAGGGLALATLLALRDAGLPQPGAVALMSPWTDMTLSGESLQTRAEIDPWLQPALLEPFGALYRGSTAREDPKISPLFGDLEGLPPLLIHVGDQEILLSDSLRLAERARAAGVSVQLEVAPELWHVWHLFAPALPDANEALGRMGAFLRETLSAS